VCSVCEFLLIFMAYFTLPVNTHAYVCARVQEARNKIEMKYANMKNMRQPENMLRKNCQFTERPRRTHTAAHSDSDPDAHPHKHTRTHTPTHSHWPLGCDLLHYQ